MWKLLINFHKRGYLVDISIKGDNLQKLPQKGIFCGKRKVKYCLFLGSTNIHSELQRIGTQIQLSSLSKDKSRKSVEVSTNVWIEVCLIRRRFCYSSHVNIHSWYILHVCKSYLMIIISTHMLNYHGQKLLQQLEKTTAPTSTVGTTVPTSTVGITVPTTIAGTSFFSSCYNNFC